MMKKTAYNNAVKELIDKGYLTLTREQNVYDFSETLVEET
jgi:hypothetical protein